MNTKEFVSWLRVFIEYKAKLGRKDVEQLKTMLAATYNELPLDEVFKNWCDNTKRVPPSIDCTPQVFIKPSLDEQWVSNDNRPFPRISNVDF